MDIKEIAPGFAVSPQITAADLPAIAAAGFRAVICNRPDAEEPGQPPFNEIAEAAKANGLEARYIPVVGGMLTAQDVADFARAMDEVANPVLAYCRSGARSTTIWTHAQA